MRRRRQKNTLLPKMIGVAVLVNAILLPLLAQLGVFKKMEGHQRLMDVQLVQAPPPAPKPKVAKKAHKRVAEHHAAHHAPPSTREARADNTPKIHGLVAPGGPGDNGNGVAGIVPPGTTIPPSTPPTPAPTPPAPTPPAPTPPAPTPPAPTPPAPTPPAPTPVPPHIPVLVPAAVMHRVEPQLPSDFSDPNLPVTFHAQFDVHADGSVVVTMTSGTGNGTLDGLALTAARQWTFHPATQDGKPVDSYLRLEINFVPSDSS